MRDQVLGQNQSHPKVGALLLACLLTTFTLNLPGCALYSPSTGAAAVVTTCNVPTDQSGTMSGKWPTTPIPIAVSQSAFSAAEAAAIASAADTWNTFFTASKGFSTINYGGTPGTPQTSAAVNPSASLCASGILSGNTFNGNVVIYKLANWPSTYAASAMALTNFCTAAATPYPRMYMAVIQLNYQYFFAATANNQNPAKVPDLQTIVTHELGHLHGLNHSCSATSVTGFPNCNDSGLNSDYSAAIMFPSFNFNSTGAGQIKRSLGSNDQSRANCLYP